MKNSPIDLDFAEDSDEDNVIKSAAKHLRGAIPGTGSSHAHAAISAFLGFNSKKALIDSGFDTSNPNLILTISKPDLECLRMTVQRMSSTPLQKISLDGLAEQIQISLTPSCECCDEKSWRVHPIGDPYDHDFPDGWVCAPCAHKNDEYAKCTYCGDHIIYRADQINDRGECPEHDGESIMSEEEEKDWDDYVEYLENHD